jgi:hypothetical protein
VQDAIQVAKLFLQAVLTVMALVPLSVGHFMVCTRDFIHIAIVPIAELLLSQYPSCFHLLVNIYSVLIDVDSHYWI